MGNYTTIEDALAAERDLINRMATSLKKQKPTIQSKFKSELLSLYGVQFTDATIETIFNYWKSDKVCFSRPLSNSRVQVWVGTLSNVSDTEITVAANCTVIYQDNSLNTISNAVTSTYQEYPTQHYFGTNNDFFNEVIITGQSVPNEIRLLKNMSTVSKTYNNITDYLTDIGKIILPTDDRPGHLLGPDGNYYKYLATFVGAAGGPGTYKIYSNYRFCTSKEYITSSTNMYLLTGTKGTGGTNNTVIIDLSTNLGTNSNGYSARISGQSVTQTPTTSGTYNNGTFPYQWAINITEAEANAANIPVFDTNQEALEYLAQPDGRSYVNAQDFPDEIMLLGPGLDFTDYTTFNNTLKEITNGIGLKQSLYTDYLYPIFSDSNKVYCLCVLKFGSSETHLYYFYNTTDGETFKLTDVSYVVNSSSSADFINNSSIKLNTNFFYGVISEITTKGSTGSTINAGTNYHLYSGTGVLVKQFNNKIY